ncbi:MAG: TatD family hydrolase [Bacteriovoracaceae bacterium]|nr:TatD family hydrolase [Bacteriovoracaceae bacterium]
MKLNYKIFDAHSHFPSPSEDVFTVQNWDYWKVNEPVPQGYYSTGLHPWYLSKIKNQNDVEVFFLDHLQDPRCLALGEVGLDFFRSDVTNDQQEMIFKWALLVANKFPDKPIIIHSVRSESEILKILHETHRTGPVIWHNYLLNCYPTKTKFALYASISPRILKLKLDRRLKIIKDIPTDKILIESDDQISEYSTLKSFMNETCCINDETITKNTTKIFSL